VLFTCSWRTSHPKVWLNVPIVQEKLVKYSQFHVNEHVSASLRSHGLPVAGYDGGVDMYGKSVEDIMAVSPFFTPHREEIALMAIADLPG
jgi:hypothetical protein